MTAPNAMDRVATLMQRANTALDVNAAFLANATPSNTEVLAQVRALTRQCNGLIRLLLRGADDTTGT